MPRTVLCAFAAVIAQTMLNGANLPLPPAIQNGFRIGGAPAGTGEFRVVGIGLDSAANMYLAGSTFGTGFPVSNKTKLGSLSGFQHVFVVKVSASGQQLLYVTEIGGSYFDDLFGMAVDPSGNVFLAGATLSADFPTTGGSFQPQASKGGAFVLKLDPSGQRLIYSTYLDDSNSTALRALAIDRAGNAYVAGYTDGHTFPTTAGAYLRSVPAEFAVLIGFVTKLSPDGGTLLASTLFGGTGPSSSSGVSALALDAAGVINITGGTDSSDFPTTPGANQSVRVSGSNTPFFSRLDNSLSRVQYSALVATGDPRAIAVDGKGNSYLATYNNEIAKFDAAGTLLSTKSLAFYLSAFMVLDDGTVMAAGDVYSAGFPAVGYPLPGFPITGFTAAGFPTRDTLQPCTANLPHDPSPGSVDPYGTQTNAVFVVMDPSGNITHSSLLGGIGENGGDTSNFIEAITHDSNGSVYLAGSTTSPQFPGGPDLIPPPGLPNLSREFAFKLDLSAIKRGSPAPSCLINGATFLAAPAVPGAIYTLFGSNLGPAIGVQFQSGLSGRVPTELAGVRVTVGGLAAPILYAQDQQINFVVPFELTGSSTDVCVVTAASQSCLFAYVAPASPGIFRVGAYYAVLNQDGTLNTPYNPALSGSVISLFGTGMGPDDQGDEDGGVAVPPLGRLVYPINAFLSVPPPPGCVPIQFPPFTCQRPSLSSEVLYAGAAPQLVNGVTQVNVRIPADAPAGSSFLGVQLLVNTELPNYIIWATAQVSVK